MEIERAGRKTVHERQDRPRAAAVEKEDLAPEDPRSIAALVPGGQSVRKAGESRLRSQLSDSGLCDQGREGLAVDVRAAGEDADALAPKSFSERADQGRGRRGAGGLDRELEVLEQEPHR